MAMVVCKGCGRASAIQARQVRIYSRTKQWQLRMLLCITCFGGLLDLLKSSADGWTEGLWESLPQNTRSQ